MRRVHQALRGRELALGVNDLRALFAFGLGLLGHGSHHAFGQVHLLDLDVRDFYAPRIGVLIEDRLQAQVNFFAMCQQFVHITSPNTERRVVCANWEVWYW